MNEKENRLPKWYAVFFPVVLALYPLRHIWIGVEMTDSAYSAGNYKFLDQMNPMWLFSTYLANKTGSFMSGLPFGDRMMGLNFYTALVISTIAIFAYFFLTKRAKMRSGIVFLGEIIAISLCWCPTTILYNYLTYLFFLLAVIFVYIGLTREKRICFFLAGIFLGFNVLVRFPNILETIMIIAVWFYGWLVYKRFKDIVQETLISILGFVCGAGLILLEISIHYGFQTYIDAIMKLLQMPSDASDYSLYSMILTPLLDYKASSRWLLSMILLVLVMGVVFRIGQDRLQWLKRIINFILIAVLFAWWYKLGVFNVHYYTYESMFQWIAVLLIVTILIALHDLFSGEMERNMRLMALMILIVIVITPMGSNNHLYPNMNNLFLIVPFTLTRIYQAFFGRMHGDYMEEGWLTDRKCHIWKLQISSFPVKAMLGCFLAAVCIQSIGFGLIFTFRDGMSGQKRDTKIENNDILKGMVTNQELASEIESLTVFIEKENLQDKQVILYGQIPALGYYLDMQPAISTSWPDLRSYNLSVLQEDLEKIETRQDEMVTSPLTYNDNDRPIVIVSAKIDAYLTDDPEGMNITGVTENDLESYAADQKLQLIIQYMQDYNYTEAYTNTGFAVFE